jgi:hypothetical protein
MNYQVQKIKKLEIDEAYANEALNKNLFEAIRNCFLKSFSKQQPFIIERFFNE